MISIITDSCADLSPELIEKYKIGVIPLLVYINEQTYLDGVELGLEQLFEFVERTGTLPKTSAPPSSSFLEVFNDSPGDIFFTGISSKLSATNQNAILAAQAVTGKQVQIVDSLNLSTGVGLLVLKAAELRDQGLPVEEIRMQVEACIPKVRTSFVIDTLDYLHMGGRCSAMQNFIGSLLKIRPVIEVRADGTLGIREKNRGTRKKALGALLEDFNSHLPEINPHRVFITHSGCEEDAQYLAGEVRKLLAIDELNITQAGATIASHCGPNTIGILYMVN